MGVPRGTIILFEQEDEVIDQKSDHFSDMQKTTQNRKLEMLDQKDTMSQSLSGVGSSMMDMKNYRSLSR